MKLLLTSLSIALATSTLAAAAPALGEPTNVEAAAPSAERLALARQFVALTNAAGDVMDELGFNAWPAAAAQIEDKDERALAEKYMKRMSDEIAPKARAHMPGVREAYAAAYAREYSVDELRQLIAFAQSPAGKRYLADDDNISVDDAVLEAEEKMWEEITPVLEDMRKEICAEKAAQRIAAGDTKAKCPLSQPDTAQG